MKLTAQELQRQPDQFRIVLLYGPDYGAVQETVSNFRKHSGIDEHDPFSYGHFSGSQVLKDPGSFVTALRTPAFGGNRLFWLSEATDKLAGLLQEQFDVVDADTTLLISAGELTKSSAMRKAFEAAGKGIGVIVFYALEGAQLQRALQDYTQTKGYKVDRDALTYLVDVLGSDYRVALSELDKMILYKGVEQGTITFADAEACCINSQSASMDALADAVGLGMVDTVFKSYEKMIRESISPIGLVRVLLNHFQKLRQVALLTASGTPAETAMSRLRPPVFWKRKAIFLAQTKRWPLNEIDQVLLRLLKLEIELKAANVNVETKAEHAFLRIAYRAQQRR
jgi:DNA polymerase-3 subunit delta